jgi:hypothetical protein
MITTASSNGQKAEAIANGINSIAMHRSQPQAFLIHPRANHTLPRAT